MRTMLLPWATAMCQSPLMPMLMTENSGREAKAPEERASKQARIASKSASMREVLSVF